MTALARLRDEAHRFCRVYHHALRRDLALQSALSEVKGLGPVRLKALLARHPTLESLTGAAPEELRAITRLTPEGVTDLQGRAKQLLAQGGPEGRD